MDTPVLAVVGLICLAATLSWVRSARHRQRLVHRIDPQEEPDAYTLAWSHFRKEAHSALLYGLLAGAFFANAVVSATWVFALVAVPALVSTAWARNAVREARLARQRIDIERRAQEALSQESLAPKAWAGRLAPDELPEFSGFDVGRVYQAGSGLMSGDFFDVFQASPTRMAAVIGDVSGHGIESSITAFQAKYLLRTFLQQFRDPAQALEELNRQMSSVDRSEEFISLVVLVFDTGAGTMRYASAGHPATFLWHQREVRPLRSTGPLLMLDPDGTYFSREIPMEQDDMAVMYTDGLTEARDGDEMFGEERIGNAIRRDPGIEPAVLCKQLLDAANEFSLGGVEDDIAILAIRKT
ncbi:MAG: PP2C family protein-serine/threonine phosphatase [Acidimicrobiales bacterium]|nr:PP2C family protein-serine/threonine phosphatase [Acidimicrobiales bacterium]